MDIIFSLLSFLGLFGHLLGQRALGRVVIRFISASEKEMPNGFSVEFVTGLLVYLLSLLLVKSLGVDWMIAVFCPYLILIPVSSEVYAKGLLPVRYNLTWNHLGWLFVHIVIGLTLFDVLQSSIITPWKNSYGDLPYHIGMISSFALADNLPPVQFIFAGSPLAYPFFINLWSASLWVVAPSYYLLSIVFLIQWVVLWEVVYLAFEGDRRSALPWLLLLGGGTYFSLGENSGQMIPQGLGFSSFLTTIWVTQRSALFGVAVSSVILSLFFQWEKNRCERKNSLLCAGFLLGLSPLVHTHICLIVGLFLSGVLILYLFRGPEAFRERVDVVARFFGYSAIAVHAFPLLLEKRSILAFSFSGFLPEKLLSSSTTHFLLLVFENLGPFLLVFFICWGVSRAHRYFLIFSALMVAAWFCRVSVWEWDQIKLFLGLYLILLFLLGNAYKRFRYVTFGILPLLSLPTIIELGILFERGESHEVFSQEKVATAQQLSELLPKNAIVLSAPYHNAAAILTGRTQYLGYGGWLWSHGIPYKARERQVKHLETALSCDKKICSNYIVWTKDERRFWNRAVPGIKRAKKLTPILYEVQAE